MKLPLLALSALLAGLAPASSENGAGALPPGEKERFEAAAAYSRTAHGVALVVMRGGEIVFEDYASIWKASKAHLLGGGTRGLCGLLASCAVEDGLLNLDERVSDTVTEWKDDGLKEKITIRQLLNLSSGLAGGVHHHTPSYAQAIEAATVSGTRPGHEFSYGPIPYQCFGELLRRKLAPRKESVWDYLQRRIITPLSLRIVFWRRDKDGHPHLASGAFLTAQDWAKVGELVRRKGVWNGTQLVHPTALWECFKPSRGNSVHGLGWWLLGADKTGAASIVEGPGLAPAKLFGRIPVDTLAALGEGKQRCYVIRSLDLVVVRMGDSEPDEFDDAEFLSTLLGK